MSIKTKQTLIKKDDTNMWYHNEGTVKFVYKGDQHEADRIYQLIKKALKEV